MPNPNPNRQDYLISFLRGCADAADRDELGVMQQRLLVNGDLMREAADEFERLLPDKEQFKNKTDELQFNLVRAEQHARQAHNMLYSGGGPQRSFLFRMLLGRAQSILMRLAKLELGRRPKQ